MKLFRFLVLMLIATATFAVATTSPAQGGYCAEGWFYTTGYDCCTCYHSPPQQGDTCWCDGTVGTCYANAYGGVFCLDNQGARAEGGS